MKKITFAISILGLAFTSCNQYDQNRVKDGWDAYSSTVNETLGIEKPENSPIPDEEDTLEAQREREAELMSDEPTKCVWCGEYDIQREMELDDEGQDFCSRKCLIEHQKNSY